ADGTEVTVVAGRLGDSQPPPAPPKSWAARQDGDVAIWTIKMAPQARWTIPAARPGTNRTLYFFRGSSVGIGGELLTRPASAQLDREVEVTIENGPDESEFLFLQGRPIGEPVVQYGPFVMNSRDEIQQAFRDYQRTEFGGWPWGSDEPVFGRTEGRFA